MISGWRMPALLAGLLGFTGVLLAALGAHAVDGLDSPAAYRAWQAASLLQLVHAGVLLALGLYLRQTDSRMLAVAAGAMFFGVLLFSGSIYLSQMTGVTWISRLPPAGGMLLLGAWLWLIIAVVRI